MAGEVNFDSKESWQARLEARFAPQIDPSLIVALVHEPGHTFDDIQAILVGLAGDDLLNDDQRKEEEGKESNALRTAQPSSPSASSLSNETEDVERALAEWRLIDEAEGGIGDAENLRMTDEEDGQDVEVHKVREAIQLGRAAGDGTLAVEEVAAGQKDVTDPASLNGRAEAAPVGFDFLAHAFPTRTPEFLRQILLDERDDVMRAIDTLTTLELIESGALDEDDDVEGACRSGEQSVRMAEDEKRLLNGTHRKKVTKRDRQRRKMQELNANALGAKVKSNASTKQAQKVNLTDVRQGGIPGRVVTGKRNGSSGREVSSSNMNVEGEDDAALAARIAREERIAAGLPAESDEESEDDAIRDNDWLFSSSAFEQLGLLLELPVHVINGVHAACHMNLRATLHRLIQMQSELYASLSDLDERVGQTQGTASALVDGVCTLLPHKSRAEIVRYVCATKCREDAVLDLCQLADRIESAASGERTDVLDPTKVDRQVATAEVFAPTLTTQADQNAGEFAFVDGQRTSAVSTPYASAAGRPSKTAGSNSMSSSRQYALQRLRDGASSVTFPLNSAAHDPSSISASGASGREGDSRSETAAEAARLAQEYAAIAQEYRQRRQAYLSKAASSYRLSHNASTNRGPMRGAAAWVYADEARRLDAKARAFALQSAQATVRYRMLINRSAVSSNASQAGRLSAGRGPGAGEEVRSTGDVVDLHGLSVHEALTITRQTLDAWWSKMRNRASPSPLHVITGVGRHSSGNIALIRPAVLAMLQRERWSCREPQQGHILILGRK